MSPRTAVVHGTGSIGRQHLGVLREAGFGRVVAVPVRGGDGRADLGDYEVLSDVPTNADLVVVATDTARHVTDAANALDRGAGVVLVEKPVASTVAGVQPLLSHPRADRVRVSAPLRFYAGMGRARAMVEELPAPVSVRAVSQSWLPDWRPDRPYRESYSARPGEGGVLRDLVHEIDYTAWMFGDPRAVQAIVSPVPSPVLGLDVYETADLLWETADGTAVSIRIDYVTKPACRELAVRSADGEVRWDLRRGLVQRFDAAGKLTDEVTCSDDLDPGVALLSQSRAMAELVSGGAGQKLATLHEGVRALEIGERVQGAEAEGPAT